MNHKQILYYVPPALLGPALALWLWQIEGVPWREVAAEVAMYAVLGLVVAGHVAPLVLVGLVAYTLYRARRQRRAGPPTT